jgi:hypothetical protein
MSEFLSLRLLFPDSGPHMVTVHNLDCPEVLTTLPPLSPDPVLIIHNNRCLCPFRSFSAQNVADGDTIVLYPLIQPDSVNVHSKSFLLPSLAEYRRERMKLADLSFMPYESSPDGGRLMRQLASEIAEDEKKEEEPKGSKTIVPARKEQASETEMPICWEPTKQNQSQRSAKKTLTRR